MIRVQENLGKDGDMDMEKRQSLIKGTAILSLAAILSKFAGLFFTFPLTNLVGNDAMGYFGAAYDYFGVFYAIATGGLPVAMSKMISSSYALGQPEKADKIYRVAVPSFAAIGLASSLLMFCFAPQLAGSEMPATQYAIRALSPTVFFCCIMSAVRGYFQGRSNMTPSAVSQTIEAFSKLLIGIPLAAYVFQLFARDENRHAYAAAGAIVGVSASAGLGMIYLLVMKGRQAARDKRERQHLPPAQERGITLLKDLMKVALPITVGSCFLQLLNLVNMRVIVNRLSTIQALTGKAPESLYGMWTNTMKIFDLPGAVTIALSASILPVLAAAHARNDHRSLRRNAATTIRLTFLITIPCAVGLFLFAAPLASIFFYSDPVLSAGVAGLLRMSAIGVVFNGCLYTTNSIMQSLGHATRPVLHMAIGGAVQIALNFYLTAIPSLNIQGAAYALVTSYFIIMVLNFIAIYRMIPKLDNLFSTILPMVIAAALMGAGSYLAYWGLGFFLPDKIAVILAILIAVLLYAVAAILVRAIRPSDIRMLPKGSAIVKKFHLYEGTHFE